MARLVRLKSILRIPVVGQGRLLQHNLLLMIGYFPVGPVARARAIIPVL